MSQSEKIIAAATAIRAYLPQLLPSEATQYDTQIATLLTQIANNQAQPTQLTALLAQHPKTREWMQRHMKGESPEKIHIRGIPPTISDSQPIPTTHTFICPTPNCPQTWTRRSMGQDIPECPNHQGIKFIPSPQASP